MPLMNRNTSPISPMKEEYMLELYKRAEFEGYPDTEPNRLKELYATQNNLSVSEIEIANGADEWIQKILITLGKDGVMTLGPDFFMYHDYAEQLGLPFWEVAADSNFEFEITDILRAIDAHKPSVFILSHPHNPTGVMFDDDFLAAIAEAMQVVNGYFVIDEAYIEFGRSYQVPEGDHVLRIRTMSKIYAMAGFRVGILIAKGETYDKVTRINHPYPMSHVAMLLATILLEDDEWVHELQQYQLNATQMLKDSFKRVASLVNIKDSHANFLFTYGKHALELGKYLEAAGFIGRFYDEESLKNTVRYSIIRYEDYAKLNDLLDDWAKRYE